MLLKGEIITCDHDHPVAEIVRDLAIGQDRWWECIGKFVDGILPPVPGTLVAHIQQCDCGRPWIRLKPALDGFTFPQIHVRGHGWDPE
jgi:hypothetical protein